MSGNGNAERSETAPTTAEASPTDGIWQSESEELMAISRMHTRGGNEAPGVGDHTAEIEELERRLREQAERNIELDTEVLYLVQELAVRRDFIAHLENELEAIHAFAGRQVELSAEFVEYQNRISHRMVDHLVDIIHRTPWLYRPLKQLGRVAAALTTTSRQRPETSWQAHPIRSDVSGDPDTAKEGGER
jgi:hypothetical protein